VLADALVRELLDGGRVAREVAVRHVVVGEPVPERADEVVVVVGRGAGDARFRVLLLGPGPPVQVLGVAAVVADLEIVDGLDADVAPVILVDFLEDALRLEGVAALVALALH